MSNLVEQRVPLKFCVSNKISSAEALKMLTLAYGDSTVLKTQAYEWYKKLKEGRTVVDDLPRSGRPSTSVTDETIEKFQKIVHENRRVSIREIAADIGVSFGSVQSRFQNRSMKSVLKIGRSVGICVLLAMEITLKGIK
ncbi:Protein GVQW3 [Anthophora plagiata]